MYAVTLTLHYPCATFDLCAQVLRDTVHAAEESQAQLHAVLAPLTAAPNSTLTVHRAHQEGLARVCEEVDIVMRSSEEALLVTRILFRHSADLLAFVNGLEIPVHPSLHHKLGKKVQKLAQVCYLQCRAVRPASGRCIQIDSCPYQVLSKVLLSDPGEPSISTLLAMALNHRKAALLWWPPPSVISDPCLSIAWPWPSKHCTA